jgi:hypothetical protein
MSDRAKKITELTSIGTTNTSIASGDLFIVEDVSANTTKSATANTLASYVQYKNFPNYKVTNNAIAVQSSYLNLISAEYVQMMFNANTEVSGDYMPGTTWMYVGLDSCVGEIYNGSSELGAGFYLTPNGFSVVDNSKTMSISNGTIVATDIGGPYENDAAASSAGVPVKGFYYDATGTVKIRY